MALTSNTQEPSVPITDPTKKKTLGEFIREIPSKVEEFKGWYAEVAKQAATPESDWLKKWREEQATAIEGQKSQYESELAAEMADWEKLVSSRLWLTQGQFQGYAAAKSYEQARQQEIADWYTEVTGDLGKQTVSTLVQRQKEDLERYRDWLRAQGTTDEDERARLAEAGLPEEEQITTEDQIREITRLQEWLTASVTDIEKAIAGLATSAFKYGVQRPMSRLAVPKSPGLRRYNK